MPTYISLLNYTEQGIKNIKDSPKRGAAARQAVEAAGGKWLGFYLTMGQYDAVVITEAPNDEAYATLILSIGSLGNVRTTTLKAFDEDEFRRIIGNIR